MKTKTILVAVMIMFLLGTALAFVGVVHAYESRVAYTLPWSVIGSGGMGGSAGAYTIHSHPGSTGGGCGGWRCLPPHLRLLDRGH